MARDLTVAALEKMKPGPARREVPDGHTRGLFFVLQPSGAASWAYRYRVDGKSRKLTIGPYPAITLKAARELASDAATAIAKGDDPAAVKQQKKAAARAATVKPVDDIETVVETFLARHVRVKTRVKSAQETERLLRREIIGAWRGRRLGDIRRADVHCLLDSIVDRPAPIVANRTLAALRRLCGFAIERGLIEHSPCDMVKPPAPEKSRDRVLNDDEIRVVWSALERQGWPFGRVGQLLLLTAQRLNEVAGMSWQEVDLASHVWTIPKERAKNGEPHAVHLSDAALGLLESVPRIAGKRGLIFTTTGETPVSGFSKFKRDIDSALGTEFTHWTLHDLRRTAATNMEALGFAPHIVDAVLNHLTGAKRGVGRVYMHHGYAAERRAALDAWAQRLDEIVTGGTGLENVVDIGRARAVR